VLLSAAVQGNAVVLEVADDGRGIDVDAVTARALEAGFITAFEARSLRADEAQQLIFLPGLSTASAPGPDAGRGVGMDAVASNIKALKGDIQVTSSAGKGTRFTMRLPLTQLVSEVLVFTVAGQSFAFAIDSIRALKRVDEAQIIKREGREFLLFEGQMVRLNRLTQLLDLAEQASGEDTAVVFLQLAGEHIAFAVDDFVGIEEVVIKSLAGVLAQLEHIGGATISASGEVILLLDPRGLSLLDGATQLKETAVPLASEQAGLRVLLVDDSVSVRRVLSKMLSRSGYHVVTAKDGQEALNLLRQGDVDVVLTDLEMPRVNGYELLEAIRRNESSKDLPVMVITSRASEKHMKLAYDLGATHYAGKPIDERNLNRFLETVVSRA
jgi:chemosensory pili system protein ChpA (sensor histidine kinase/response regulator)